MTRIYMVCLIMVLMTSGCNSLRKSTITDISEPRYLIVTADDLCMTEGITNGIVEAYRNGIVTTTSALMNYPGARETIIRVHQENPELPIGIHLNITTGKPVLPPEQIPSLVDKDGYFYHSHKIIRHLNNISIEELRAEVNAQVEQFLTTGVPLDHINSENHMLALYTPFHKVVRETAIEQGIPVRNPVPESVHGNIRVRKGGGSSKALAAMMGYAIRHPFKSFRMMKLVGPNAFREEEMLAKQEGIPVTDWFVDSFYGNADIETFISILEQIPPGISELMSHPGFACIEESPPGMDSSYINERELELEVLTSTEVRAKLHELNIRLIDFSYLTNVR
ncbi:MAG: ChbG/HpnK family deacetylase [Marinilabiliales bacterium]|nr:MAG: ChbG/HpnK family deacetylase [Marinilabiliales bacterium]